MNSSEQHPQPQGSGEPQALLRYRTLRKLVVFVVGMTILIIGLVMLILPGPGIVGILAGLALLATEFVWARHALRIAKEKLDQTYKAARNSGKKFMESSSNTDDRSDHRR